MTPGAAWKEYILNFVRSGLGKSATPKDLDEHVKKRMRGAFVAGWKARAKSYDDTGAK